jgi:hypothetical protein
MVPVRIARSMFKTIPYPGGLAAATQTPRFVAPQEGSGRLAHSVPGGIRTGPCPPNKIYHMLLAATRAEMPDFGGLGGPGGPNGFWGRWGRPDLPK